MIICRLLTTLLLTVLHTMTHSLRDDAQIPRDYISVNVGKRVRMECELGNSIKSVNIKGLWLRLEDAEVFFYSSSRIYSDQRFQIEQRPLLQIINGTSSYEVMTYSLIIDDVRLSDDGTYSCQADNRIIKLFVLNVVERPYFVTHEYTTLLRTQVGKNVSIACEAQGKPSPLVSWMKKMDDNQQKTMINCTTTPTTCQLKLFDVNRWHHGTYECVAMNSIATISRPYELDVQFPPDVHTLPLKSFHSIGDTVTFHCLIDANPEPDIRWLHRLSNDINQRFDLSRHFHHESSNFHQRQFENEQSNSRRGSLPVTWTIEQQQINSTRWKTSLTIKQVTKRLFNTDFICKAVNRHGEDEKSITIISNHHHAPKRHRHTTTVQMSPTPQPFTPVLNPKHDNEDEEEEDIELPFKTHFLPQDTNGITNRSRRISSYLSYSFILGLYLFVQ